MTTTDTSIAAIAPEQIFREYDIRGIAGTELTPATARAVGQAFAVFLADTGVHGAVAVGRDNRPSGVGLHAALVQALTESGINVIDVGIVPTPTLYWCLEKLGVGSGVQITASHNPAPYNGFKCVSGRGPCSARRFSGCWRSSAQAAR